MSDTAVDDQSIYNTIEKPTLAKALKVNIDIEWRLIVGPDGGLKIAKTSKNRADIVSELQRIQKEGGTS